MLQEEKEGSVTVTSRKLDFINKELSGNKITSKLLADLLLKEEKRKALLETRAQELSQVTNVKIRDHVGELAESIASCISQTAILRGQLGKVIRGNLPNKCDDSAIYLKLDNIDLLEKSRDYVLTIHFIILISSKLSSYLKDNNYAESISMYNQLRSLRDGVLRQSDASNLHKYCSGVLATWELELNEKVKRELGKCLEKVGWPSRIDTANPSEDSIKKFQNMIRCYTKLTYGDSVPSTDSVTRPVILIDYRDVSPLVQLLMQPIRKRFKYHFYSSKATADDTKPEWYFTQVKQWVRELVPFLGNYIEPVQHEVCGNSTIVEFILGLSQLLVLKTDTLLSGTENGVDDVIFSKILEESSRFESEVKSLLEDYKLGDKEEMPGFVSTIFSQPHILNRWLSIEKRGALEKLDILFSSASAWNRVVIPGPTEIGELFVMMLRFVVDRFSYLRQPGQKIQFIQLIIEILDDFRIRCLQVWKSKPNVENLDFLVAETLGYVHGILQEWEATPFFSTLDFFWDSIRKVEKEDLEERTRPRLPEIANESSEDEKAQNGMFSEVSERYASSMEMLLISISQR